jgi:hypothetical protein
VVPLPNVGRESHTILWHIVTNYDRLANLTVFSQGSAPTHGYGRKGAAAGDRGGHLLSGTNRRSGFKQHQVAGSQQRGDGTCCSQHVVDIRQVDAIRPIAKGGGHSD